jgi:N-acetylglucosaminyldiphosphoundecaprenol N-acetyl-beta-D-mannosaminyltransferase
LNARVVDILGYRVFAGTVAGCADSIVEWVNTGDVPRWVACFNPHSYATALHLPEFAKALRAADWLVPDGAGVVFAAKLLNAPLSGRITGSDVFAAVNARLSVRPASRVAFLGGKEETLSILRDKLAVDHPRLQIVGSWSPAFEPEFDDREVTRMVGAINDAQPDVLWVGLGAPKQELLVNRIRDRLQVKAIGCVGAVFDFYTGRVRRSPAAFQRAGLEWLPRLLQEPRRLWRRTFVSAPLFVRDAIRERLQSRRT